jgi:hypothetical protein
MTIVFLGGTIDEISGKFVDFAAGGKSLAVSLGRRKTVSLHTGMPEETIKEREGMN